MTIKKQDPKNLAELVKENFCDKQSVVACGYYQESWCPKTCGFYKRNTEAVKYWNRRN